MYLLKKIIVDQKPDSLQVNANAISNHLYSKAHNVLTQAALKSNSTAQKAQLWTKISFNAELLGPLIRSDEYFSVYKHREFKNHQISDKKSLIITLNGISNPQLTLLQRYMLLNPCDKIQKWNKQNIEKEHKQKFHQNQLQEIRKKTQLQNTKSNQGKENQSNTQNTIQNKKIIQLVNKNSEYSQPQSGQVHQQQKACQLKLQNQANKVQKQTSAKVAAQQQKKHYTIKRTSIYFLYFYQKCFNSFFRSRMGSKALKDILLSFKQIAGKKITFNKCQMVQKIDKHLQTTYRRYKSQTIDNISLKEIQKILSINTNFNLKEGLLKETYLLGRMYASLGLRVPRQVVDPETTTQADFQMLFRFQNTLKKYTLLNDNFKRQIQEIFSNYAQDFLTDTKSWLISTPLDKAKFKPKHKQLNQEFGNKIIAQFYLQNLINYNFITIQQYYDRLKVIQNGLNNKIQQAQSPNYQTTCSKNLHFSLQKTIFSNQPILLSSSYGLLNFSTPKSLPIFLYQISQLKTRITSISLIQSLIEIVFDVYEFFDLFKDTKMQISNKKYLMPINSRTLILDAPSSKLQYDKLQILRMLFQLETNPLTIELYIVFIKRLQYTAQSKFSQELKNVYDQIKITSRIDKSLSLSQIDQKLLLLMLPFSNFFLILFEIYHPDKVFQYQLRQYCCGQTLQNDIFILIGKLFQNIKNPTKITNSNLFQTYISEITHQLTSQKYKNLYSIYLKRIQNEVNKKQSEVNKKQSEVNKKQNEVNYKENEVKDSELKKKPSQQQEQGDKSIKLT